MSESDENNKSMEAIARQFDLPERKSKIASITREQEVYCHCRSTDTTRFMIACDECEEWYHGDCVNITEEESKHIKNYYCQLCKQKNEKLQIIFRLVTVDKTNTEMEVKKNSKAKKLKENVFTSNATSGKSPKNCGTCQSCRRRSCKKCEACLRGQRCKYRICRKQSEIDSISGNVEENTPHKKQRSASPEDFNPELEGIRHCYGPGCRYMARSQSKYCSDECGIKLADVRINTVLPLRLKEWNQTHCHATQLSQKKIDSLNLQLKTAEMALSQLETRFKELEATIKLSKEMKIDPNWAQEVADFEDEVSVYCITCGHETNARNAVRHMEKCFNKVESQSSFCSTIQARLPGHIICDYYNPTNGTYCKRLTVICPEHSKVPKVDDTDICGAPLNSNFSQDNGELCRAPKKICNKHHAWEKIRRAEIDLERLRQWMKIERLTEERRLIEDQLSKRGGLLPLLLHSTNDHSQAKNSNMEDSSDSDY